MGRNGRLEAELKLSKGTKILLLGAFVALVGLLLFNFDPVRRLYYGVKYESLIIRHSQKNDLDPYLVAALIYSESGFRSDARSDVGALGLMQLMPETAREVAFLEGVDSFEIDDLLEPETNIRLGTIYLSLLLDRFQDTKDALAAYNAGPTLVSEWKDDRREIPFPETRRYVDKVVKTRKIFRELYPQWSDRDS